MPCRPTIVVFLAVSWKDSGGWGCGRKTGFSWRGGIPSGAAFFQLPCIGFQMRRGQVTPISNPLSCKDALFVVTPDGLSRFH
ncbi:hypothetical protein CEXT_8161 [Caerostris extrusa]|uniref:Secreted protein n=1 Tax=Caerostris extrusa TaxID=172846 RepID=A0AAV4XVB3_CAEEX|nr:hypothetical protein CEXT_8161 [Caerostris extrusa]